MTPAEALIRLQMMRGNLTGARGMVQRSDGRALDVAIAVLRRAIEQESAS